MLKWNWFFFKLLSAWQWRLQWLVWFGVTALVYAQPPSPWLLHCQHECQQTWHFKSAFQVPWWSQKPSIIKKTGLQYTLKWKRKFFQNKIHDSSFGGKCICSHDQCLKDITQNSSGYLWVIEISDLLLLFFWLSVFSNFSTVTTYYIKI